MTVKYKKILWRKIFKKIKAPKKFKLKFISSEIKTKILRM